MVPAVYSENSLVVSRELPRGLELPKTAGACFEEVVVKQSLVIVPVPSERVQLCQLLTAQLHVLQRVALWLLGAKGPCLRNSSAQALLKTKFQRRL